MNRRTVSTLASCLLPLALVACAGSQANPPPAAAPTPVPADPATSAVEPALLPLPPQPPERPEAPAAVTDPAIPRPQRIENFIAHVSTTYGVDADDVRRTLAGAQLRQSILDAMSRPAERTRTWAEYRPIFINNDRIAGGRQFYRQHRDALERVAAESGVPAEYIVAIIGVETSYGRVTGNYRVLDALYTLAFDFPRRAPFFAEELAHLFALAAEEPHLELESLKGSYAGAMGLGQFMPSSYRLWARDGDGDGSRDLIGHLPDVFASIANYFVVHGWERGAPVVARAARDPDSDGFTPDSLDPVYPLATLAGYGYHPQPGEPEAEGATLLTLEGDSGTEYWLGYRNFYVITRYNRSPMYALSVHQLASAIREGVGAAGQ